MQKDCKTGGGDSVAVYVAATVGDCAAEAVAEGVAVAVEAEVGVRVKAGVFVNEGVTLVVAVGIWV